MAVQRSIDERDHWPVMDDRGLEQLPECGASDVGVAWRMLRCIGSDLDFLDELGRHRPAESRARCGRGSRESHPVSVERWHRD